MKVGGPVKYHLGRCFFGKQYHSLSLTLSLSHIYIYIYLLQQQPTFFMVGNKKPGYFDVSEKYLVILKKHRFFLYTTDLCDII